MRIRIVVKSQRRVAFLRSTVELFRLELRFKWRFMDGTLREFKAEEPAWWWIWLLRNSRVLKLKVWVSSSNVITKNSNFKLEQENENKKSRATTKKPFDSRHLRHSTCYSRWFLCQNKLDWEGKHSILIERRTPPLSAVVIIISAPRCLKID